MKRLGVIIAISLIIIVVIVGILIYLKKEDIEDINVEGKEINSIKITEFNIEGRSTLKIDGEIYLGNNLKELENGFYDIKISNINGGIVVSLNKLWYEDYDEDYIQDDYLAKICRELSMRLDVGEDKGEFEYSLYKYIKENYTKVRNRIEVEELETEKYDVKFELEDDVVRLILRSK